MKKVNWITFIIGLIFMCSGIGVIFLGVFVDKKNAEFMETAEETEATIVDIVATREYDRMDERYETKHTVYVSYEVDGEMYEYVDLSYYTSSMRIGDTVTVYYDPLNPYNIETGAGMKIIFIAMSILGGIFTVAGLVLMVCSIKRTTKLKKIGKRYDATVVNIELNTNVSVNRRHPYRVTCRVEDYGAGEAYIYKSKNVYLDLEQYNLETVPVYVDPQNPSKFFVDVEEGVRNMLNTAYSNNGSLQVREFE